MKDTLVKRTNIIILLEAIVFVSIIFFQVRNVGLLFCCFFLCSVVHLILVVMHVVYRPKMFYLYILFLLAAIFEVIRIIVKTISFMP
jgi:hypothetical protein